MISAREQERHLVDLEFLQGTLQQGGIETELIQTSAEEPLSFLTGIFPEKYKSPEAIFKLVYIPADQLLEQVAMLQIYCYLDKSMDTQDMDAPKLIATINKFNMMGNFGIDEANSFFFRYVYAVPRFSVPNESAFLEVINLCFENFSRMARLTLQVSEGHISSDKAMSFFTE